MSKHYAVAQAACFVTIPGVGSVLLYRDAPVPDSVENLAELEADGFIVEVAEDTLGGMASDIPPDLASPAEPLSPVVATGDAVDDVDGAGPIPAKSATKPEWVAYAVSQGAAEADAEAKTKDELIAEYGAA